MSDIRREFGGGPYIGGAELVRTVSGEKARTVRGPRSEQFKFEPSLCQPCNNTRSQPIDAAYETLAAYLRSHEERVWRERRVSLPAVYGPVWKYSGDDLLRYVVKHVGCRLADRELELPQPARAFLDGRGALDQFAIEPEIRTDIVAITRHFKKRGEEFPSLWLGDVTGWRDPQTGEFEWLRGHFGFGWFRISWYCGPTLAPITSPFPAGFLELRSGYAVNPLKLRVAMAADRRPRLRRALQLLAVPDDTGSAGKVTDLLR